MRYVTLDYVVRNICAVQLQDASYSQYVRVARAVRSGVEQASLHLIPAIKSAFVTVDENFIGVLPHDATLVTKVGVPATNGKIITILRDRKLRRDKLVEFLDEPEYCECDVPPDEAVNVPSGAVSQNIFHNVFWPGNRFYGELYSVPTTIDYGGSWNYNMDSGVLEFGAGQYIDVGCKVLVEYKAAGECNMIPIEAQETIEAYALYKLNFHIAPGKAQFSMGEFKRQARMLKSLYGGDSAQALLNSLMLGQKSTV